MTGHARAAAWLVLLSAGGTMASFNIWHALHSGMNTGLAWLVGIIIVVIVMATSHVAASGTGRVRKGVTFAVMVGAMVLSVRATGDVVRPAFGPLWWLFGLVVDSAALVALQTVMTRAPEPAVAPAPAPAVLPEPDPQPAPKPVRTKPAVSPATAVPKDVDAQAAALAILEAEPAISGAELARRCGRSDRWGQGMKKQLAPR